MNGVISMMAFLAIIIRRICAMALKALTSPDDARNSCRNHVSASAIRHLYLPAAPRLT